MKPIFCAMICAVLCCGAVRAQDSLNIEKMGGIGILSGFLADVAVSGDYAYVLDQNALRVVNIANPYAPQEMDFGTLSFSFAYDIKISGNYAVIVDVFFSSLMVVDISDPATPLEVGWCNIPSYLPFCVAVSDDFAYVADSDGGLAVVDFSNPTAPIVVGSCDTPGNYTHDVAVSGNYAYMKCEQGGMRVIDISDPSNPHEVGWYNTAPSLSAIAVSGNYAYLGDGNLLRILDISNPQNPTGISNCTILDQCTKIAVSGNFVYVVSDLFEIGAGETLHVIDVSNPLAPIESGFYETSGGFVGLAIQGCRAYVAGGNNFGIYDISYFEPCPVPRAPDSLVISYVGDDIKLSWSPVVLDTNGAAIDVDYYVVYRSDSTESLNWDSIGVPVPPDTTVYMDSTATDSVAFYQVRAVAE